MTDGPSSETVRAQRRATYDFNVEQAALSRKAQADYGRWLLTALLVIHAGALTLSALDGSGALRSARCWATAGLALTLLAGLMAWANWTFSVIVHTHWADDRLLDPANTEAIAPPRMKRVADLAWLLAIGCAMASAAAVPVALWSVAAG